MTLTRDPDRCFEHEAFIYASDTDYVEALAPAVATAVEGGDPVVAVVPEANARLLQAALPAVNGAVKWIDAAGWYRHPVRTIAGYAATLREMRDGPPPLVIGEVQFGSTERDWRGWTRYESAINRSLAAYSARVICPYDERVLPESVIAAAACTHPLVLGRSGRRPSSAYVRPETLLRALPVGIELPPTPPDIDVPVQRSVRAARAAFVAAANSTELPSTRIDELAVALNEVLTNAIVHGGGMARLRIWRTGGTALTVAVDDLGAGCDDTLLGYLPPDPDAGAGYGLWLARQMFDRSELTRSPAGGLQVVLTVDA